jgi:hypothetical protein
MAVKKMNSDYAIILHNSVVAHIFLKTKSKLLKSENKFCSKNAVENW